jgi:hypothetical protein
VLGTTYLTPDAQLFQTAHIGVSVIDLEHYKTVIDGLVQRSLCITLDELKRILSTTITSFHDCYGPPSKPPTDNYWWAGNLEWTGVPLENLPVDGTTIARSEFRVVGWLGSVSLSCPLKGFSVQFAKPSLFLAHIISPFSS